MKGPLVTKNVLISFLTVVLNFDGGFHFWNLKLSRSLADSYIIYREKCDGLFFFSENPKIITFPQKDPKHIPESRLY